MDLNHYKPVAAPDCFFHLSCISVQNALRERRGLAPENRQSPESVSVLALSRNLVNSMDAGYKGCGE